MLKGQLKINELIKIDEGENEIIIDQISDAQNLEEIKDDERNEVNSNGEIYDLD